jgi:hypothetical protein
MPALSRRGFLTGAAAGAAAAGVAVVAPTQLAGASTRTLTIPDAVPAAEKGPVVDSLIVHVRNFASGEISLFAGDQEITVRDRGLSSRLAAAAKAR